MPMVDGELWLNAKKDFFHSKYLLFQNSPDVFKMSFLGIYPVIPIMILVKLSIDWDLIGLLLTMSAEFSHIEIKNIIKSNK